MSALDKVKDLLTKQQKQVEEEIVLLDQDDPINSNDVAESSEPGTDSWVADTHTRTVAVKKNLQEILVKIKHSLQAVASGKYGKCENCGKNIEASRLEAMSTATLCISCSKK